MNVQNKIHITMIGPSGVGKTCFMVGMYGLMRDGLRGFTFDAEDPDVDLDLSNAWEQIRMEEGADRWPLPNDHAIREFAFHLRYAYNPISLFRWIDYRGGALSAHSSERDVQELREHVRRSDCLCLCVSGEALAAGHWREAASQSQAARMSQLLERSCCGPRPPPGRSGPRSSTAARRPPR